MSAANIESAVSLETLGVLALQNEDPVVAIDALTRALQIKPRSAITHANLASALQMLDRTDEALQCLSNALQIDPAFLGARYNRGCLLMQEGRHAEALADFQQVLEQAPDDADALNNNGMALLALRRTTDALEQFRRARQVRPEWPVPLINEAVALLHLLRAVEAITACDAALELEPNNGEALVCRADALVDLKRFHEAILVYERALGVNPNHVRGLTNIAKALTELNQHAAALLPVNRALALEPRDGRALIIKGVCLSRLGAHEDALQAFGRVQQQAGSDDAIDAAFNAGDSLIQLRRPQEAAQRFNSVLDLQPDRPHALGRALHAQLLACDWSQYGARSTRVIETIRAGRAADAPFSFLSLPATAADQLACAKLYSTALTADTAPTRSRRTDSRIRLAYLSADFREHPVAQLAGPLLERHDRSHFEVVGVCLQPFVTSESAERFKNACERFIDVSALSDERAAARLRELQIDIAVDLTGYTMGERSGILARRPAPVQVGYLGYPSTSGSSFIDYLIADEIIIPASHEPFYSETIVRLPHAFFPADWTSRPTLAYSRNEAGLHDDAFVFCGFAAPYKISPIVFDTWMRLVRQVPDSMLWLRSSSEAQMANLRVEAAARHVDPTRLVFASPETQARHLARYAVADLFLDTQPYGAHTTAMEALKAGLPVITCLGDTFASRVAASQLHALNMGATITRNMSEYEALALRLASNRPALGALRRQLSNEMENARSLEHYCRTLELTLARLIEPSRGE